MSEDLKFLVDENLLGLLRWLRVMGVDSITYLGAPDHTLISEAQKQGRLLLTKDRRLFNSIKKNDSAYLVRSETPKDQIIEVLERFHLGTERALTRCFKCNSLIQALPREAVSGRVDDKTYALYERFYECPQCQHVFWEGSHYEKMQKEIQQIKRMLAEKS